MNRYKSDLRFLETNKIRGVPLDERKQVISDPKGEPSTYGMIASEANLMCVSFRAKKMGREGLTIWNGLINSLPLREQGTNEEYADDDMGLPLTYIETSLGMLTLPPPEGQNNIFDGMPIYAFGSSDTIHLYTLPTSELIKLRTSLASLTRDDRLDFHGVTLRWGCSLLPVPFTPRPGRDSIYHADFDPTIPFYACFSEVLVVIVKEYEMLAKEILDDPVKIDPVLVPAYVQARVNLVKMKLTSFYPHLVRNQNIEESIRRYTFVARSNLWHWNRKKHVVMSRFTRGSSNPRTKIVPLPLHYHAKRVHVGVKHLYQDYLAWCRIFGMAVCSRFEFSRSLGNLYPGVRVIQRCEGPDGFHSRREYCLSYIHPLLTCPELAK